MKTEKQTIKWSEIDDLVFHLSIRIRDSGKEFDRIVAVPRGGFIPAVMLSHRLGIPIEQLDPLKPLPLYPKDIERTLIVDEICDSGKTLGIMSKNNETATFAVLYHNIASRYDPDFAAYSELLDKWLVFPWEQT